MFSHFRPRVFSLENISFYFFFYGKTGKQKKRYTQGNAAWTEMGKYYTCKLKSTEAQSAFVNDKKTFTDAHLFSIPISAYYFFQSLVLVN